jgi:hypothetical protein
MTLPKVEIKCPAPNMAEIWIDGHKLPGVRDISLYLPLGEAPYVRVEIITTDVTFEGMAALDVTAKDVISEESFLSDIARRVMDTLNKQIGCGVR